MRKSKIQRSEDAIMFYRLFSFPFYPLNKSSVDAQNKREGIVLPSWQDKV